MQFGVFLNSVRRKKIKFFKFKQEKIEEKFVEEVCKQKMQEMQVGMLDKVEIF